MVLESLSPETFFFTSSGSSGSSRSKRHQWLPRPHPVPSWPLVGSNPPPHGLGASRRRLLPAGACRDFQVEFGVVSDQSCVQIGSPAWEKSCFLSYHSRLIRRDSPPPPSSWVELADFGSGGLEPLRRDRGGMGRGPQRNREVVRGSKERLHRGRNTGGARMEATAILERPTLGEDGWRRMESPPSRPGVVGASIPASRGPGFGRRLTATNPRFVGGDPESGRDRRFCRAEGGFGGGCAPISLAEPG